MRLLHNCSMGHIKDDISGLGKPLWGMLATSQPRGDFGVKTLLGGGGARLASRRSKG